MLVIGSGWHSGISSEVRLAAWTLPPRATPSTSPFFESPRFDRVQRGFRHPDPPLGPRHALRFGLVADVHHTGLPCESRCVSRLTGANPPARARNGCCKRFQVARGFPLQVDRNDPAARISYKATVGSYSCRAKFVDPSPLRDTPRAGPPA